MTFDPSELLASPVFGATLRELASQYDMVILDTAPVLSSPDAAVVGTHAAAVMVVVRSGMNTVGEIRETAKRLIQAGAAGGRRVVQRAQAHAGALRLPVQVWELSVFPCGVLRRFQTERPQITPPGETGMHGTFGWDTPQILDAVFKAYDIRGTVPDEIDARFAHSLGMAVGTQARDQGARSIVVGRDGRISSVELAAALQAGLRSAGMHVIDIGMATTPMVYFATRLMDTGAGIAVTGSHNPPAHNGFKIVLDGASLYGEGITALRDAMRLPIESATVAGGRTQMQIQPCYAARLLGDIRMARPMKIAIDCGSGVAGAVAPALFPRAGLRSDRALLRSGRFVSWPPPRPRQIRRTCKT